MGANLDVRSVHEIETSAQKQEIVVFTATMTKCLLGVKECQNKIDDARPPFLLQDNTSWSKSFESEIAHEGHPC